MLALTWLRGPARAPPRPPARDRARRRRRRRAAGLDRRVPVGVDGADDRRGRSRACRSTGRSRPARRCFGRAVLRQVRAFPGRAHAPSRCVFARRRVSARADGSTQRPSAGLVLGIPRRLPRGLPRRAPPVRRARERASSSPSRWRRTSESASAARISVGRRRDARRQGPRRRDHRLHGSPTQLLPPRRRVRRAPAPPPDNVLIVPVCTLARAVRAQLARRTPRSRGTGACRPRPRCATRRSHGRLLAAARPRQEPRGAPAGTRRVGNNLAAALDAARGDSLYAALAFLFLGAARRAARGASDGRGRSAGADRRRREQALLRARGATRRRSCASRSPRRCSSASSAARPASRRRSVIGAVAFGSASFGAGGRRARRWAVGRARRRARRVPSRIALPAWRDARRFTVARRAHAGGARARPVWARFGSTCIRSCSRARLLARRRPATNSCSRPRGSQVSVDYWSFARPAARLDRHRHCSTYRVAELASARSRRVARPRARSPARPREPSPRAWLAATRRDRARSVALVALTTCFAVSTAAFNTTYQQQAGRTRGSRTAPTSSGATAPSGAHPRRSPTPHALPGVTASVEPLQHRYAYIGTDLQDLYGVNARTVGERGAPAGRVVRRRHRERALARLARDAERCAGSAPRSSTTTSCAPATRSIMRLLDRRPPADRRIRFRYIGIAGKSSRRPQGRVHVVNAGYVARARRINAGVATLLVQTAGANPRDIGRRIRSLAGTPGVRERHRQRGRGGSSGSRPHERRAGRA